MESYTKYICNSFISYLCEGWDIIDGKRERIPYFQVWHGKCPHVSMCLKKRGYGVHELNFSMEVFQESRENQMERLVVQAIEDRYSSNVVTSGADSFCLKHKVTIHCPNQFPSNVKVKQQCSNRDIDNEVHVEIIGPNQELPCTEAITGQRLIPENVRVRLKVLLDVKNPVAMNWKYLAEKLGYDSSIPYLESQVSSPTEFLLGVVESRKITVRQLMVSLFMVDGHLFYVCFPSICCRDQNILPYTTIYTSISYLNYLYIENRNKTKLHETKRDKTKGKYRDKIKRNQ